MTIKAFLGLEDKMTPTLSKAEKQAIANAKAFDELKKETQAMTNQLDELAEIGAEDTKMFNDLSDAVADNVVAMVQYSEGTRNAKVEDDNLSESAMELNSKLELLQKAWSALSSVIQQANDWMKLSDTQFNSQFTAAVKMHSIMGANEEEIQSMYDYAGALQSVGVVGDEATIAGMSELAMYTDNMKQIEKLTPAILDLAVAQNGLETNMSNVESTANMVGRALSGSAMMIKRQLGLTDEQVKALDSMNDKSEKTAYLYQLIESRVGGANQALAQTAQGSIIQAQNSLSDLGETMGEMVTPYFAQFEQILVQLLTPIVEFVGANADWLIPTLLTLTAVIGGLIIVTKIWTFLNSAAALSVLKIVLPILLIIGVIYLVMKALEKLTGQSINFFGLITGMVSVLSAIIYNIVAAIWNVIAYTVDAIVDAIRVGALVITGILWGIAWVANKIAQLFDIIFGTSLSSATQSVLDSLTNTMDTIKSEMGSETAPKLEFKDIGEAARAGYEYGSNFSKGIEDATGSFNIGDTLSNLDSVIGTDINGDPALNTTSKDNLLKEEDIQLLLDIATRDFKLDYQQITPQITLTFGDVHETADVDGIIEEIVTELEEVYDSSLEVVPVE